MGFKENLRFIRQAEGYTQQTLAEAMGVSRPTVTQWESGWSEPRMGTIKQIAATLNVSVADLISDTLPDVETIPPSTREEKRLLSMFRRLDDVKRAQVMGYVEGMVSSDENLRQPGDSAPLQTA